MNYEVLKFINEDVELDVRFSFEEGTIWLSLSDLCLLFGRDKSVVSRHIKNILLDGILDENRVVAKNATTGADGKTYQVTFYNLDIVVAVGNRIKSKTLSVFYSWVKEVLSNTGCSQEKEPNIITFSNNDIVLDVKIMPENDTVYLTVDQMALLFGRNRSVISRHIKNIYEEGELDEKSTCAKNAHIPSSRNRIYETEFFNLDVIISVGYRVKSQNGILFRKWALFVLKEYLLKGYVINEKRTLITNENYINLVNKVSSLDDKINKMEERVEYLLPEDRVIYDGQVFDALVLIDSIVSTAKETVVLFDPYVDLRTLNALKNKNDNVSLQIITSSKKKLSKKDVASFNKSYGDLLVKIDERHHDRYLIIDDKMFYHLGSSINYLGKRLSQITIIEDEDIKCVLRTRIIENM